MGRLTVAVIGLGKQSLEDHIPAIEASRDVDLIAVSDINQEKLKAFLASHPEVKGYRDFETLLQHQKPDFVIIALPHYLHFEATKFAIRNGIHVLKEKPFAVSLKEAEEIKQLAERHRVKVSVTLQRRFNPIYATFFQLIDKIGKPFYLESKYTLNVEKPEDGWRGQKELAGGGCLVDMGYHAVDLLIWYFGLPDQLFAEMSHAAKEESNYTAEDTAQVLFRFDKCDLWGSLLVSRVIPPKQEYFNVYGTRGIIHLERGKIERYAVNGALQESLMREHSWPSAAQDQIEYFTKVIRGERENINPPEFHFNHLAFIAAAYRSAETRSSVSTKDFLPLPSAEFPVAAHTFNESS